MLVLVLICAPFSSISGKFPYIVRSQGLPELKIIALVDQNFQDPHAKMFCAVFQNNSGTRQAFRSWKKSACQNSWIPPDDSDSRDDAHIVCEYDLLSHNILRPSGTKKYHAIVRVEIIIFAKK